MEKEKIKAIKQLKSDYYQVALKGIQYLKKLNAKKELKTGFSNEKLFVRYDSWRAVCDEIDQEDLEEVVALLEIEKEPLEGSESATIQKKMKREILLKLEEITKEKVITKNIDDEIEIDMVIKKCRNWCDKHLNI